MENNIFEKIREAVETKLGKEYQVGFEKIEKNNGVVLNSIAITDPVQKMRAHVYIDKILEAMELKLAGVEGAADEIVKCYTMKQNKEEILHKVRNLTKETVLNSATGRIVNKRRNEGLLNTVEHTCFLDLAVTYQAVMDKSDGSRMELSVSHEMCRKLGISREELHAAAVKNMGTEMEVNTMCDLTHELCIDPEEELDVLSQEFVLSNKEHVYGAVVMLYPDVFERIANVVQDDLYILPSSIHEVITVPVGKYEHAEYLVEMIGEINDTELRPEEVLSASLYRYDRERRVIEIEKEEK